jgi:predicted TPR repeat methyltransferase
MYAALVNHAVLDYEEGDFDAATEKLTSALDQVNDDPDLWFNRGVAHQAAGRHAAAVDDYTAALALPGADRAESLRRRDLCRTAMERDTGTRLAPVGTP